MGCIQLRGGVQITQKRTLAQNPFELCVNLSVPLSVSVSVSNKCIPTIIQYGVNTQCDAPPLFSPIVDIGSFSNCTKLF